jgi:hypothetical protein
VDEYRRRPPAYPLTADLSGVLAAARQLRADDTRRAFSRLARLVQRLRRYLLEDKPLDSAGAIR